MLNRLLPMTLAVACVLRLAGQTASASPATSQPDAPTVESYRALFAQVTAYARSADKAKAAGKDDAEPRHQVKKLAGLTDAEETSLGNVATVYANAVAEHEESVHTAVTQYQKQNPTGRTGDPAALQRQLDALNQQDLQNALKAIQDLHDAFGEARFQKLDQYVRTAFSWSIGATTDGKSVDPKKQ